MQDVSSSSRGTQSFRSRPSRFVDHMQQLFGEDPDPQFLEDSWSIGVPAAIENLHRRRRLRATPPGAVEIPGEELAIRELERMAAIGGDITSFLNDRSQPIERRYAPAWMERATAEWSDPAHDSASAKSANRFFDGDNNHAADLLGVSPAAGREEIRSAYRSKVSQCHPDRYQDASEATRRRATEQLANLNEAYRVLCAQLFDQAA